MGRPGPKPSNPARDMYALAVLQKDPMAKREHIAKAIMKEYPETNIHTARQVVDRAFRDMLDEGKALRPFRKHRVRNTLEEIVRESLDCHHEARADGSATATWLAQATTALKRLSELDALEEPSKTEVSFSYDNSTPYELQAELKRIMLQAAARGDKLVLDLADELNDAQGRLEEGDSDGSEEDS